MFVQIFSEIHVFKKTLDISNRSNLCVVGVYKLWDMGWLQQSSWRAPWLDLVFNNFVVVLRKVSNAVQNKKKLCLKYSRLEYLEYECRTWTQ